MPYVTLPIAPGQREPAQITPGLSPDTTRPGRPVRSLYIHIPFCFHKCHYCDFYSLVDTQDRMPRFVDRLLAELRLIAPWADGEPLRTVFVGGGTPTMLPPPLWRRLLDGLARHFDLSAMTPAGGGEFTVECNPETASEELFDVLASGGVNRLSLGAQTFNTHHLKTLQRWHDPANIPRAVALARAAGILRQSLDLIYAIPGQTAADVADDLDRVLALGVEHVSAYSLTYEPGTEMTARLHRGEFTPTPDNTDAEMMTLVADRLSGAGLRRYEVSNFARPGAECRHNLAYWRGQDWMAAGPSASGHVAGHRWKNIPRLGTYLDAREAQPIPIIEHEPPDPRRALVERVMTGLRLCEGLDAAAILEACRHLPDPDEPEAQTNEPAPTTSGSYPPAHRAGEHTINHLRARIDRLTAEGLIHPRGPHQHERWALTDTGFLSADRIAAELMAIVDP